MIPSIDSYEFYIKTKIFEQESIQNALKEAKEIVDEKKAARPYTTASKISTTAFKAFKKEMESLNFENKNLLQLTLQSRETVFNVHLKDRIIEILEG